MAKKQALTEYEVVLKNFKNFCGDDTNDMRKLINATKTRQLVQAMGFRSSDDLHENAVKALLELLLKAAKRCMGNNRTTITGNDL